MEKYSNILTDFINTVNNDPIVVHVGFGKLTISNENHTFNISYHLMKDNSLDNDFQDEDFQDENELFNSLKYEFDYFNVEAIDNVSDDDDEFELTLDDIVLIQDSIRVEIEENDENELSELDEIENYDKEYYIDDEEE